MQDSRLALKNKRNSVWSVSIFGFNDDKYNKEKSFSAFSSNKKDWSKSKSKKVMMFG